MRTDPRSLRVLVVDDCPDTASSCTEFLCLSGFDTRSTGCGCVALALCAVWNPDVVLLDLWMPGVDGFEVARQLCEREGGIRLVAVTGLATRAYRERAVAAGFDHFLVKPVEPAVLVDLLREWAAVLFAPAAGTCARWVGSALAHPITSKHLWAGTEIETRLEPILTAALPSAESLLPSTS